MVQTLPRDARRSALRAERERETRPAGDGKKKRHRVTRSVGNVPMRYLAWPL